MWFISLIRLLQTPWTGLCVLALIVLGLIQFSGMISSTLGVVLIFLTPGKKPRSFGEWAVVTGATDGIGKAYCMELAKQGMSIFLLSRSTDRLKEVASEIEKKFKVQTEYLSVDFSKVTREVWNEIRSKLKKLDVGVLVNNVGASYEHYEYLHAVDDETVDRLIEINVRATTEMTRCVLPEMVAKKKGAVLNIGSGVGSMLPATPLLAVYAGTKAFVEQFSKSCYVEYKSQGVVFQDQAPLFVATKMSKIRKPSLTAPSPEVWVKGALGEIGKGPLTAGYWMHNVMWSILSKVPPALMDLYTFNSAKAMRAKALKKKAMKETTKKE